MAVGKKTKVVFRVLFFLVLAALGTGLYFSNEIRNRVDDWKNYGKNSAKVQLPETTPIASPVVPEDRKAAVLQPPTSLFNGSSNFFPKAAQNSTSYNENSANATLYGEVGASAKGKTNSTKDLSASPSVTGAGESKNDHSSNDRSTGEPAKPINSTSVVADSGERVEVGGTMPVVYEDSIISRFFIDNFADFLVKSYVPPKKGEDKGEILLTLRSVNLHYAAEPKAYFKKERAEVLRYIMPGSMLEALYRIYVVDFVRAMQVKAKTEERVIAGKKRPLNSQEVRDMFAQYSHQASGMSAVFEAFSASSAISGHLAEYYSACTIADKKNGVFREAALAKARAVEVKNNSATAKAANAVNAAAVEYEQSVKAREAAKATLLAALHKYPGVKAFGDDNSLYCAAWVNRRLNDGSASDSSIAVASRIFANLATHFKKAAEK